MYKKRPHLVSYLNLNDRAATPADYYIPPSMKDKCRVLDVSISEHLCAKLSCNRTTERAPCTPDLEASYYWVGDDDYDVQCQPACFNVRDAKTYQANGSRDVDMPQLNYHKGSCRIVPDGITSYLEKPFYRSAVQYERRVNDMPTGFSRVRNDRDYGCGFDYRNNASYCAYYDRTLDDDGDCSYEWWEQGLDAVVGMSFVNTVKSAVRQVNGTEAYKRLPDNLPPKPKEPRPEHTLNGWRSDVYGGFVVPDLLDVVDVNAERRDRVKTKVLENTHYASARRERSIANDNDPPSPANPDKLLLPEAREKLQHLMENVMRMLQSSEFWTSLGVSWMFDRSLDEVKRFSYKVMENIQKLLSRDLYRIAERAFCKTVLTGTVQSTARTVIVHTALRTAGKFAIALAKMTVAATSVVGWLLIIVNVLDIVFALWDPYGYDKMFPKELPNDIMLSGEAALRSQFGASVVEYKFENLVNAVVTEDEILQLQLTGMLEKAIYLDSLETNSEGAVIDKRDIIILSNSDFDVLYDDESNRALARRVRFDRDLYDRYNCDFLRRVNANRVLSAASSSLAAIAIITACFRLYALAFFFIFILLICLALGRFAIHGGDSVIKLSEHVGW